MQTIILGGRSFDVVPQEQRTIRYKFHIEATLVRLGLDKVEIGKSEHPDDFAKRLFREIIATGKAVEVVALFLVPTGGKWSPEEVTRTAAYIDTLTDPVDHMKIKDLVVQAFIGFFGSGLASLVISRTSLGQAAVAQ